jgi:hypothetical protein
MCRGEKLSIVAKGDFKKEVEEGSKTHLIVKYNKYITLINQDADTCETVKKADLECPLKKGEMKFSKDVDIPAQVPPVRFTVSAFYAKRIRLLTRWPGHVHCRR